MYWVYCYAVQCSYAHGLINVHMVNHRRLGQDLDCSGVLKLTVAVRVGADYVMYNIPLGYKYMYIGVVLSS